jgi:hypothetical protein
MTTTAAHAMLLASFVGDSLALGFHWIYDTALVADRIGRVSDILALSGDSYHPNKNRGELTHYGDQSLDLLTYLASSKGHFSLLGTPGSGDTISTATAAIKTGSARPPCRILEPADYNKTVARRPPT